MYESLGFEVVKRTWSCRKTKAAAVPKMAQKKKHFVPSAPAACIVKERT